MTEKIQTLGELRNCYLASRLAMIERHNKAGLTQTEAAKELGVTLQCLGNIIYREGIVWKVKRQGFKAFTPRKVK